jgi:hypothetical protein
VLFGAVAHRHILHTHTHKDDMYQLAKECSRGWRTPHNGRVGLLLVPHLLQRPTTPTHVMRCLRCSCRLLSCCLAISCSISPCGPRVLPRVTVHSVGRLGRGCTLTRSCNRITSHTTASTCRILARSFTRAGRVWNHSLHPRPLDSEISRRLIAWLACHTISMVMSADSIHSSAAFV